MLNVFKVSETLGYLYVSKYSILYTRDLEISVEMYFRPVGFTSTWGAIDKCIVVID